MIALSFNFSFNTFIISPGELSPHTFAYFVRQIIIIFQSFLSLHHEVSFDALFYTIFIQLLVDNFLKFSNVNHNFVHFEKSIYKYL